MIEIIPAIDLINGQCVRLTQGDYAQKKIYNSNPVEVALSFEDVGCKRLHLVDLDGAKAGAIQNLNVLSDVSDATNLKIDFSGGVKTADDIQDILNAGGEYVGIGSLAVKQQRDFISLISTFGPNLFLLGADVQHEDIVIHGWQEKGGISIWDFLNTYIDLGIKKIFCTDISVDGMLTGPSVDLYQKILQKHPQIELIASGGVSKIEDVHVLNEIGCHGVIVGKAIYEGRITMEQLALFNKNGN